MKEPIKLFLLTGFLGAGKTTFLQNMIDNLKDHKIGIIMNEFGDLSIDGVVLKEQGMDVCELNQGSIFCCCLKEAFVDSLVEYSSLPIEYLFVESSGMADPSNIESILDNLIGKVKGNKYNYMGAICIVDVVNFLEQLEVLLPIERQILTADYIIVNKADLVESDQLLKVENKIKSLNSTAKIVKTSFCNVDFNFIKNNLSTVVKKNVTKSHSKESINTLSTRPVSHIIRIKETLSEEKVKLFVKEILPWVLRIKGFLHLDTGWKKIDVSGIHVQLDDTNITRDMSELVIISNKGLPAMIQIYNQWEKFFDIEMELE
ncbi:GTP-binding protein [Megamonas funiformis]|uniref:CobW family GTP-binding protein n=1 Tax=Megamonas funiformis TaxID=437897 RepID=UPI001430D505|nr:CobW family GTP-binding protein [Megamonas funiformis]NJE28364.1 GTP-binding protein [Megamonas funiformis]